MTDPTWLSWAEAVAFWSWPLWGGGLVVLVDALWQRRKHRLSAGFCEVLRVEGYR